MTFFRKFSKMAQVLFRTESTGGLDKAVKKSALVTFGVIMSALILCACEDRCCVDAQRQRGG